MTNLCGYNALRRLATPSFAVVFASVTLSCQAQAAREALPDGPALRMVQTVQVASNPDATSATVTGTVHDVNGTAVPDASVVLRGTGESASISASTDQNGQFKIANLPAGVYTVAVSAEGFAPYLSASFLLRVGEQSLPAISLAVAAISASVQVTTTQEQVAEAEVKAEEQQRFLGVLPNFYTSFTWDAAPMNARQKFNLASHSAFDPVSFLSIGLVAGIEQARNIYPAYHQGAEGYAKRYGASFGDEAIGRLFASAVYPSLFHQDPRYFYKGPGGGTKTQRAVYAISRAFVTRNDRGKTVPNYSLLLGRLTAGAIANAYHPAPDRGVGLTFENAFLNIGGHAADNLVREFLVRRFIRSVPSFANGQASAPPQTAPRK